MGVPRGSGAATPPGPGLSVFFWFFQNSYLSLCDNMGTCAFTWEIIRRCFLFMCNNVLFYQSLILTLSPPSCKLLLLVF